MKPHRTEADSVFEKLPIWTTRFQTIEGRQPGRGLGFEIGKNIILDDGQPHLLGEHQQAMGGNGGKPCTCRIMDCGIGDIKPRLMVFQCLLEKHQMRSVGV